MIVYVCVWQAGSQAKRLADFSYYEVLYYMYRAMGLNKQWALNFHLISFTVCFVVRFYYTFLFHCISRPTRESFAPLFQYTQNFGTRFGIRNFFWLFSFVSVYNGMFFLPLSLVRLLAFALKSSVDCDLWFCVNVNYAFYCQKDDD